MQEARQPARPPYRADGCYPQEFRSAEELRQHYKALKRRMDTAAARATIRRLLPPPEPPVAILPPEPGLELAAPLERFEAGPNTSAILTLTEPPSFVSRADILRAVSAATKIGLTEIRGHGRSRYLVDARFVYYVLARKYSGGSLPQIGQAVGYRDHSTVLHGLRQGALRFAELLPVYRKACAILGVPVPDVSEYLMGRC
jgi:hypothetical protein